MLVTWHFIQPNLNNLLELGRPAWKEARTTLQKLLSGWLLKLIPSDHIFVFTRMRK